jgi:hypothetical protein
MTDNDTREPMYAALSLMERKLPPLKFGREPYWRAPITRPSSEVFIPAWNWHTVHEISANAKRLTLDTNGAYLGAMGSVQVAHCHLHPMGAWETLPAPRRVPPGYYRILVPYWAFSGTIVSPLGDSPNLAKAETLWVAAPTLTLLLELLEEGGLPEIEIIDSYTAPVVTEFRSWSERLRSVRTELLDNIERAQTDAARKACREQYNAFKEGYSAALSMMLTGEKCKTRRPDWTHTILAQHAATQWRKAWRYTATGRTLVRMGAVDELTILADDLDEVLSRTKPPFRYDPTGRQIGALKPKPEAEAAPAPTSGRPLALVDDGEVL